jgi:hypothetical protein
MGNVVPDRLFWAQAEDTANTTPDETDTDSLLTPTLELPPQDPHH